MAIFYKKDLNFIILAMISMEKGFNKFKLLFKKYRQFKSLFQKELGKETLFKH
jgi:hypothetical protein